MALASGTRLGPYEITAQIGAGGMGEVYRATDTNLKRAVAIKVLPASVAADRDRLARFQREAEVLASLNHPNIAAIYGLERSEGGTALVMELVDGPTLAERLAQGPIAVDEALPIAKQIAEALETAHEQGIVHRDLKPANIKLRPDSVVKVLDFGLAKLAGPPEGGHYVPDATASPTITSPALMTGIGVLLGTAAYMSPEQAKGKPVGRRGDLWAFGCVLYEMLTGARAFAGDDVSETLAEIIKSEPKWEALPLATPVTIRRLLRRCLTKDPKARMPDAGAARIEIEEALTPGATDPVRPAPPRNMRRVLAYTVLVIATAVVASIAAWRIALSASSSATVPMRLVVNLAEDVFLDRGTRQPLAISSDGTRIVYSGVHENARFIYVRPVAQLESTQLDAIAGSGSLFLSPDGQWIGYNDTVAGALRKVPTSGGAPTTIASFPALGGGFRGASWGAQGVIAFATVQGGALMQVPESGGTPEPLTSPADGEIHRDPFFLPDGNNLLFVIQYPEQPQRIASASLDDPQPRLLVEGDNPRFSPSGHLLFQRGGALWAIAFDSTRLAVTGRPVRVMEGVDTFGGDYRLAYDVASNGSLVYSRLGNVGAPRNLVWVDRKGGEEPLGGLPTRAYQYPRLSPDGTQLALDIRDEQQDIWLWDFRRQTLTRFTFDRALDAAPVWTPDGQRLVFGSQRGGVLNLFWQPADGAGSPERLTDSTNQMRASGFTPDGTQLLVAEDVPNASQDVGVVRLDRDRRMRPLLHTMFSERNAEISPDGRWLAYESNESGRFETYVRPFPDVDRGKWLVSTAGCRFPAWARSGRELFYMDPDGALMATTVDASASNSLKVGTAMRLISGGQYYTGATAGASLGRPYDVSPDGRFLMIKSQPAVRTVSEVVVVVDWFEELKRLLPTDE